MAVTTVSDRIGPRLPPSHFRWPSAGVDPAAAWADDDPAADELLVYFARPVGSTSVAIDTPDRDYVYLLVDDDDETVVRIHIDDLKAWMADDRPRWTPLLEARARTVRRPDAVAALLADAAGLFALYGAGAAVVGGA